MAPNSWPPTGYYDNLDYAYVGHIYRSVDSGQTWSATSAPTTNNYGAIACSADGSHLLAAGGDGRLYTSTNSGATWSAWNFAAGSVSGVASSADGTRLFAVTSTGRIYTSTNAGVAWTPTSWRPRPMERGHLLDEWNEGLRCHFPEFDLCLALLRQLEAFKRARHQLDFRGFVRRWDTSRRGRYRPRPHWD
jgi:hypothetical protein